jgi:hypothetical protein
MSDPRVVRGSTYASLHRNVAAAAAAAASGSGAAPPSHRSPASTARSGRSARPASARAATPPPVEGRQHSEAQTGELLEELAAAPEQRHGATQTERALDRPVSPLFVPQASGEAKATWVDADALFDFEMEVEPVLEVLAGKALQQALCEVLEEEELASVRRQRLRFEQQRNAALAETQRLEAAEARRRAEHERRLAQDAERRLQEQHERRLALARSLAKQFAEQSEAAVLAALQRQGVFFDEVDREVRREFAPWLAARAAARAHLAALARQSADELVRSAVHAARARVAEAAGEREAERRRLAAERRSREEAEAAAAAERRRKEEEAAAAREREEAAAGEAEDE